MKETSLLLLCAVALASGEVFALRTNVRTCTSPALEALEICADNFGNENVLIPHKFCDKFYKCSNGRPYAYNCPSILLYDPIKEECEWPHLVICGDRPISDSENGEADDSDCDNESDNEVSTIPPADKEDSSNDSENVDVDENLSNENDSNNIEENDSADNEENDNISNDNGGSDNSDTENGSNEDDSSNDIDDNLGNDSEGHNENNSGNGSENDGICNCRPDEALTICATEGSSGILIAHENCNQFYKCDHGKPVEFTCPVTTFYNPYIEQCDWPSNVDCGDRLIPDFDDTNENDNGDNNNGGSDYDDNGDNGNSGNDIDESDNGGSNNGGNDNGGSDNGGNDNNGTCNCNPDEAPKICASENASDILIAHENCNQFYKCDHGKPVEFTCPATTFYNPYKEQCDWPSNVECGDRLIPDSDETGGNDNGGNDNGDGEYSSSENDDSNTNDNGGNHDDDSNDNNEGDDGGNNSGANDFDDDSSNDIDDNLGDDTEGDIDDNLGNGSENNGTYNCNPDEAATICAGDDSSGTLIAHENCNQFYKCDHGKPVEFTCPATTFYNPYKEQCDWPSNVECGDRLIPDSDDSGGNDNGGNDNGDSDNGSSQNDDNNSNNNDDSNDNNESDNVGNNSGANDNDDDSSNDIDDNLGNDTEGDIDDNLGNGSENNGTCNCNPDEAATICAGDDSSGTLIAHENCNQFYKCDHGKPVEFTCPATTFYNPYKEQCDWPSNVECGDRLIPDSDDSGGNDNGGNDNGDSDNGSSQNDDNNSNDNGGNDDDDSNDNSEGDNGGNNSGANDNDDDSSNDIDDNLGNDTEGDIDDNLGDGSENNGTCNCNPDEAATICAGENSSGTLIAHENCNQFYKCDHGKPVEFTCPATTFYNPYKEQCDWPSNVECGDRLIPDSDDSGGNDNGGNDNGDSDNGSSQNDDNNSNDNSGNDDDDSNDNSEGDNGGNNSGADDNDDDSSNDIDDNLGNDTEGDIDDNLGDGSENNGTCNCNPDEAATICAGENSSSTLIAHENCNQFYKCDHGKPVEFTCPATTFYNPFKEQCDWPSNVECGDRLIPDTDDTGGNDNAGNDNGDSDNGSSENDDNNSNDNDDSNDNNESDNGGNNSGANDNDDDSSNDIDDNLGNDTEGDIDDNLGDGSENDGTCNCNPDEATSICAGDDSSGTLIAHENCNQFYKCDHGKPVEFTCPATTFYDPYKEQCDWPSNVECGDRLVPDSDETGGNDNGDSDNGSSENDDNNSNDNDDSNDNNESDNGGNNSGANDNDDDSSNDIDDNLGNDTEGDIDDNLGVGSENDGTCYCNPDEAASICAGDGSSGTLIAHENCNQFYKCDHGKPVEFTCPATTFYNPYKEQCDWPSNVECGDRLIPDSDETGGNNNGDSDNGSSENDDNNGNDNNDSNDNNESDNGDNNSGANDNDVDSSNDIDDNLENDTEGDIDDNLGDGSENDGTCNCNPDEAATICAGDDSSGTLIAHENCNQFYKCDHGKPVEFTCPATTFYNPYKEQCDWPSNVECGDRLIPDSDDSGGNDNGGNDNGDSDNGSIQNDDNNSNDNGGNDDDDSNDNNEGDNGSNNSGANDNDDDSSNDIDDNLGNDTEGDIDDNLGDGSENNGTCNCNPDEAASICAGDDSSGTLIAHENCNQFYKCDHGKPVEFTCPATTFYNPYKEQCDWPSNVKCGDRLIPDSNEGDDNNNDGDESGGNDNGGNDNGSNENDGTCNCNPNEALTICAGENSSGILISHQHCNQFYKCDHGKPVEFICPETTFYNPYKEQCDWPSNVECGDRLIPDYDYTDDSNNGGNNNSGNDNNNGGSDNNPNGNDDDSSNDIDDILGNDSEGGDRDDNNNETEDIGSSCEDNANDSNNECNCDPEEAPSICAGESSNGVFVAHQNCNQFYQCTFGVPAEFTCPPNTLYNPYLQQCDWTKNVDCGDRVIPESNDNNDTSNESDIDDNLDNDPENNGECNCNPEDAPFICASEDSDGILIAHENCNQFYKCSHSIPVAITCPSNTLYNPYVEQCDWERNVHCGDRIIPDPEEDNSDNDNNDGDSSSEDANNNIINDDPSQAPAICSKIESSGVLVAHENCNKFYQCSGGKPVAISCPGDLLFNPLINQCDWPQLVVCGDRVKPEDDSECACNPRNAPALCSRDNSDGKFIAHENCNQFYVCVHGVPLANFCAPSLFYNIEKQACDWPHNVDCSSRTVVTYFSLNKHLGARKTLRK